MNDWHEDARVRMIDAIGDDACGLWISSINEEEGASTSLER